MQLITERIYGGQAGSHGTRQQDEGNHSLCYGTIAMCVPSVLAKQARVKKQ